MTRPNVVDVDVVNDVQIVRQMTDAEYAQYQIDLESVPASE